MDNTFEEEISTLEEEIVSSEGKRKFEDSPEEQQPSKALKLWNYMKNPFKKITIGTYVNESDISDAEEVHKEEEESSIPETNMYEGKSDILECEDINNAEAQLEIENTSENTINKHKFCIVM